MRPLELEAMVEQNLRQQRNELALLLERLEKQTQALRLTNERLLHVDRERRALIQLVVSDIRSALSVIAGYAEFLANMPALSAEQASPSLAIMAINEAAVRIQRLIEHVREIDEVEEKMEALRWESVDIVELVLLQLAMLRDVAALKQVRLLLHDGEGLPQVPGDYALLECALRALFEDVIALVDEGSTVNVRLSSHTLWITIKISWRQGVKKGKETKFAQRDEDFVFVNRLGFVRTRLIVEGHGGQLALAEEPGGIRTVAVWLSSLAHDHATLLLPSVPTPSVASNGTSTLPLSDILTAMEGRIRINTSQQKVWLGSELAILSPREYRLLLQLILHDNQVLSHEQLLAAVWGYEEDATVDNLRVLVWRLRQKLEKQGLERAIRTVRGFGYMLVQ
jgi:hypothetical protein